MLHLGSSVLLSGVNAFHEPQECGAWGEGSRPGQHRAAHPAIPARHQLAHRAAPWSFMALRGQDLSPGTLSVCPGSWHSPAWHRQLLFLRRLGCIPSIARSISGAKRSSWVGGVRGWFIFFMYVMKLMGLEGGREGETAGDNWKREKAGRAGGREGLVQREGSVLQCSLPMVCSWIRSQEGLGLVYSWGLLRSLEGFAFV